MPVTPEDTAAQWAPEPKVVAVGWLLTATSALVAAMVDDPRGRLLLIVAAVLLGLLALYGTRARPRLSADARGITVRGMLGSKRWSWGEVNVRLVRTRRLGRETSAVELDADNAAEPALVLLGRLDLGADPQDVVNDLLRLRT
ncbi:PH domain-containing protein [Actinokineospora diospyrosa]|uniref:PH domain-containing protein n=1 Tax=Actinokineospora diospyrosa TaxID=103728 RepID=A0ABT1ICZ2_9PSEU|nr:PH domain-containing protein [Actinokineospora diospyrosa]MCP2270426.1 PH domain-containing protein [Actinokineospora diospyrosa]